MKKGILLIVISVIYTCSHAQYFNKIFTLDNPCTAFFGIKVLSDSQAVVKSGICVNGSANSGYLLGDEFTLFDINHGTPLYSDTLCANYNIYSNSLLRSYNGKYLDVGTRGPDVPGDTMFMVEYGADMQPIANVGYSFADTDLFGAFLTDVCYQSGNLYTVGWLYKPLPTLPMDSTTENDIYILKTDTMGNKVKDIDIGHQYTYYLTGRIIALQNGDILVSAERGAEVPIPDIYDPVNPIYFTDFIELDTGLNIVRRWESTNDSTGLPNGVVEVPDGYVYSELYRNQYVYDDSMSEDSDAEYCFNIRKVDKDSFTTLWDLRLDPIATQATNQLIMAHDSSFITVGKGWDTIHIVNISIDSEYVGAQVGWIIRINPDGSLRWQRGFQNSYFIGSDSTAVWYSFQDVVELPGGDIVAVGSYDTIGNNVYTYAEQGWMVRVDSNGCFLPDCQQPNAISEVQGTHISWKVAPNPLGAEMYVYFDAGDAERYTMQVTDMTGRPVMPMMSLHNDVTYTISTEAMAGGIYIATLLRDGSPIQSLKLVKE